MPATTTKARTKAKAKASARRAPARGSISEASVVKATGEGWAHWNGVLDRWARGSASGWSHRDAAAHLEEEHGVPPWWGQMVTVGYERARGIREVNQRAKGYGLDVQRTIAAPAAEAFAAFADAQALSTWFSPRWRHDFKRGGNYANGDGDRGTYLAIDAPRRIRLSWENPKRAPGSVAEIAFTPRGRGKTAVRVSHERLPDAGSVAGVRKGWSRALDSLRAYLATGKGISFDDWTAAR
jgi:uncharacterized protein YndB with AHSA1/START domain